MRLTNGCHVAFIAAAGVFMALSAQGQTPSSSNALAVYASVGPELAHYELDTVRATLTKRDSVTFPQNVHYAWPHPSRRYLYVVWSDGAGGIRGTQHGLSAFTIDPRTGTLRLLGQPVRLAARPIHVTVDATGTHVLVVYNAPSSVTVHRLASDGTIGTEVPATQALDAGIMRIRYVWTDRMHSPFSWHGGMVLRRAELRSSVR